MNKDVLQPGVNSDVFILAVLLEKRHNVVLLKPIVKPLWVRWLAAHRD